MVELAITGSLAIFSVLFILVGLYLIGDQKEKNRSQGFNLKKEPRLDWVIVLGFFLVYLGLMLFIIVLHIMAIDTTGNVQSVLNTTFIIFLVIYVAGLIFGLVGAIIQLLRWITWIVVTPDWMKKKVRGEPK